MVSPGVVVLEVVERMMLIVPGFDDDTLISWCGGLQQLLHHGCDVMTNQRSQRLLLIPWFRDCTQMQMGMKGMDATVSGDDWSPFMEEHQTGSGGGLRKVLKGDVIEVG